MAQPKFVPKPGQLDYTNIRYCPVFNCIVTKDDKILLVQRSADMNLYPNYWNGISGFLDDDKSIEEKVTEELGEELSLKVADVLSIKRGQVLVQESEQYKKTWIVFPVLVAVKTDEYQLDWEAQAARWLKPAEAFKLNLLPGFDEVLRQFF